MPITICPKCKRLHYVPGECPAPPTTEAPAAVATASRRRQRPAGQKSAPSPNGKAAAFDAATARSSRAGASNPPPTPIATAITSPKGRKAIAHGDKPMTRKARAALGKVVDVAADALERKDRARDRHRQGYWAEYGKKRRAAAAKKAEAK